jgi:hypothetical protein
VVATPEQVVQVVRVVVAWTVRMAVQALLIKVGPVALVHFPVITAQAVVVEQVERVLTAPQRQAVMVEQGFLHQ